MTQTPAPRAAAILSPCECSLWEIGTDIETDGQLDVTIETTGCTEQTKRTFAPGHDAKLKALLIRAGVEDLDVRYGRSTGLLHTTDAHSAAARFDFGHMITAGIERGRAKAQARADRQEARKARKAQAKPPRQVGARVVPVAAPVADLDELVAAVAAPVTEPAARPEPEWRDARIKVGRWTYAATIDTDGNATYRDRDGKARTVRSDKYTEIAN